MQVLEFPIPKNLDGGALEVALHAAGVTKGGVSVGGSMLLVHVPELRTAEQVALDDRDLEDPQDDDPAEVRAAILAVLDAVT